MNSFHDLEPAFRNLRRYSTDESYKARCDAYDAEIGKLAAQQTQQEQRERMALIAFHSALMRKGELEAQSLPTQAESSVRAAGGADDEPIAIWWQAAYNISDMAQNIGAKLQSEQKRPSNSAIAKEIEKRINDIERSKGRSRRAPNHDTIRGALTGWKWQSE